MEKTPASPVSPPDILPFPVVCPGCGGAWSDAPVSGACVRCGMSRAEVQGLLAAGCSAYTAARAAAQEGRYAYAIEALAALRALGLPELAEHPTVRRLTELCAAALMPQGGVPRVAVTAYEAARQAAGQGDWAAALEHAIAAVQEAPDELPIQRLEALCRSALEGLAWEERIRPRSVRQKPRPRVRFVAAPAPLAAPVVVEVPVQLPPPSLPPRRWEQWAVPIAIVSCLLATGALVTSTIAVRQAAQPTSQISPPASTPTPVVVESPHPAPSPSPTKPLLKSSSEDGMIDSRLRRIWETEHEATDEAMARRWFNEALRAHKTGDDVTGERLAAAAALAGTSTYLYADALLLRAQCAENLKSRYAAAYYLRLAEQKPDSAYAPLSLLQAARIARQQGRAKEAEESLRRLQERYPTSREARRAGRGD